MNLSKNFSDSSDKLNHHQGHTAVDIINDIWHNCMIISMSSKIWITISIHELLYCVPQIASINNTVIYFRLHKNSETLNIMTSMLTHWRTVLYRSYSWWQSFSKVSIFTDINYKQMDCKSNCRFPALPLFNNTCSFLKDQAFHLLL